MIKILNGIHETVSFEDSPTMLVYDNTDYEEYPLHWHTPIEIIMPVEGGYHTECNNVEIELNTNDILFIPPGVLHRLYAEHGRRIIFQIDVNLLSAFDEFESFMNISQPALIITPAAFPNVHAECVKLMEGIKEEYFSEEPLRDAAICSKLLQMLVLVRREYTKRDDRFVEIKPNKQQEYVEKFIFICDYINQHCTENLSLDDVSDIAGFSKYHFSRLFKEFTGTSYYKYLNVRRISYAEKLLLDPEINVTEAAVRSGYNSISAFMRMFKIVKNCTPTEFRNMYKWG